jgi:ABC-type transporter Mla MlaB component
MATSEENDLIGYDPLAWMEGVTDENEDHLVTDQIDSDDKSEEPLVIEDEISMVDDYSDDTSILSAMSDAEGNSTVEDEMVADEVDSAFMEGTADDSMNTIQGAAVADDSVLEQTDESLIDLDATLTIQNVVKLYEKLKDVLSVYDQIEINASDVSSIDTATLQLLVSLKKDADKLQKKVTIIYPSPRFVESAQLLGLLDVLGVDGM